ncbi:MAG: polysaccharide deacetylase family protein [Methylococcales bacterium]|nr:polysaccharide deacetylase family protein [Methylococcales bacterium]
MFILIYHRVFDEPDYMYQGEADKKEFSWQMQLLARYFNVLPLSEALRLQAEGRLPSRAVAVTFDDGYADNLYNALPILKENRLTATFFIASGFLDGGRMWNDSIVEAIRAAEGETLDLSGLELGICEIGTPEQKERLARKLVGEAKYKNLSEREDFIAAVLAATGAKPDGDLMLTTAELLQLYHAGMEIGGHTVSHPILKTLSDAEALSEIATNKKILEEKLGTTLKVFAYPNGKIGIDFLPKHAELVKSLGYEGAVSTEWGVNSPRTDRWRLARFTPWDKKPYKFLLRMMSMYRQVKS